MRMFQFIASGALGAAAFTGGISTAALGIVLHYSIALGAAVVYYLASQRLPILIQRAAITGMIYGVLVFLFMNRVIIPLSAIGKRPFVRSASLPQIAVHMLIVGPTIALAIRHYSR
jgi:uncharacterized membrane protein YagU involved in acid resistance